MADDNASDGEAPPPRVRRLFGRIGWFVAASPAGLVALLGLHALHVRSVLGRWPRVYQDDPDTLLLRLHESVLVPFFIATVSAVVLWAALSVVVVVFLPSARRTIVRQTIVVGFGILLLVLFWNLDPRGYITWLAD
jgi:hypothetical protein